MQIIYTNDFIYNSVLAEKGIKFVIRGYCFVKDNKKWLHRIFTKDINAFKDISLEDLEDNCQLITSQKKTGEDVLNDLFDVSFTPTLEMTTPNLRVETGEFVEHEDPNAPEEKIYTTKYGGEAFGEYRFRINSGLNNNTLKGIEGTYRAIALIGEKYTEDEKYMVSQNKSYLAMVIYFDGAQNKDKCPNEDTNGLTVTDDTAFTIHFQFALSELDYLDNSYVDPKQHIEMDLDKDYKKLITQFNQQDQTTIKWETPGIFLTPKGKEYSHRVNLEEPNMREQHEEISYFDKNILLIPESDRNNNIFNITTKFMIFDDHKDNFVHPQMLLSYGGTESAISSVFVPQSIAFEYDPKYFALNEKAPTGHTRFDVFGGRTKKEVTGYDDKKFDKMNGYLRMLSDGGEHFGGNDSTFFMSKDNSAKTTFSDLWISDKNQISSNNTVVVDSRMNSINQVNNGFIVDAEVSNFAGQDGLTVFSTYKSSAASSLPNYDPKKNDPYICPDCNGTGIVNTPFALLKYEDGYKVDGWNLFQLAGGVSFEDVKTIVEKSLLSYYDFATFSFFSTEDCAHLYIRYNGTWYDTHDDDDSIALYNMGLHFYHGIPASLGENYISLYVQNHLATDVSVGPVKIPSSSTTGVIAKKSNTTDYKSKCGRCDGDGRIGAYGYPGNNIHIGLNTSSMDFNGYNNTFIGFKGLFSNFGHDAVVFGDHNACGNKEYDMCETCHGDGRVQCTACCFDPETEPAMSLVTSPENWNPFGQVPAKELIMCPECQGYGKAPKSHVRCDMCNGTQYIDDKKTIPCVRCGQTGQLYVTSMSAIYPCDSCTPLDKDGFKYSGASGTGLVESDNVIWSACPECSGYGRSMCLDCSGAGFLENYEHALRTSGCATCRKPLETDYGNMTEGVTGLLTICPACSAWAEYCTICNGTGEIKGNRCWNCEGTGTTPRGYDICDVCKGDGKLEDNSSCPTCSGTGHSRTCELCEGDKQVCAVCGGFGLVECEYCTDMPGTNGDNTVLNSYVYDFALFNAAGKPKYKVIREVDAKNAQGVVTVPAGEYDIVAFMWYDVKQNKNNTYEGDVAKVFRATNGLLIVNSPETLANGWGLTICFRYNGNLYPNYPVQYYQGSKERAGIRDNKTGKKFETINDFLDAALVKTNTKNSFSRGFVPCFECNNNYLEDTEDCPWCKGNGWLETKHKEWKEIESNPGFGWNDIGSDLENSYCDCPSNSLWSSSKDNEHPLNFLANTCAYNLLSEIFPKQMLSTKWVKQYAKLLPRDLRYCNSTDETNATQCVMCNGRGYINGVYNKCNACDGTGYYGTQSSNSIRMLCPHCSDVSSKLDEARDIIKLKFYDNTYSPLLCTFNSDGGEQPDLTKNLPYVRGKRRKNNTAPFGLTSCSLCNGAGALAASTNERQRLFYKFYASAFVPYTNYFYRTVEMVNTPEDYKFVQLVSSPHFDCKKYVIINDSSVLPLEKYVEENHLYIAINEFDSGDQTGTIYGYDKITVYDEDGEIAGYKWTRNADGRQAFTGVRDYSVCRWKWQAATNTEPKKIVIEAGLTSGGYVKAWTDDYRVDDYCFAYKVTVKPFYTDADTIPENAKFRLGSSVNSVILKHLENGSVSTDVYYYNDTLDAGNSPVFMGGFGPGAQEWWKIDELWPLVEGTGYVAERIVKFLNKDAESEYIKGTAYATVVDKLYNDDFNSLFENGQDYKQYQEIKLTPDDTRILNYTSIQLTGMAPALEYVEPVKDLKMDTGILPALYERYAETDKLVQYFNSFVNDLAKAKTLVNKWCYKSLINTSTTDNVYWADESGRFTICPKCSNINYIKNQTDSAYNDCKEVLAEIETAGYANNNPYINTFLASHKYSISETKTNSYAFENGYESFCDACNPNATPQIYLLKGKSVEPDKQGKVEEGAVKVAGIIDCPDCGNDGAPPGEHICESCLGAKHWYCNTCKGDGEIEYRPTVAYEDGKVMAVGDGYFYKNLFSKPVSTFDMYKDYVNIRPDENCDIGRGEYLKRMNLFSVENNGLLVIHNNNYDDIPTSDVKRNYNKDFFAVRSWAKYDSLSDRFANLQNCCYATDGIYFPKRTTHNEEWKLRLKELQYLITDSYIKTNASMLKTTALNQAIADFYKNNTTYLLKLGPIISYAIKGVWKKGAKGSKGVKGMTKGTKGKKGMKGLKGLKGTKGAKGYYEKIVVTNKRYKYTLADILAAVKAEYGQTILDSGNLGKDTRTYTFYCLNEDSENSLYFKGVRIRKGRNGNYQTLNAVKGCKPYSVQRLVYKNNGYNGEYGIMNFNYSWNREFLT